MKLTHTRFIVFERQPMKPKGASPIHFIRIFLYGPRYDDLFLYRLDRIIIVGLLIRAGRITRLRLLSFFLVSGVFLRRHVFEKLDPYGEQGT